MFQILPNSHNYRKHAQELGVLDYHAPENPARLDQAGVTIMLTSQGLDDVGTFLKSVRKAVQRGLSAESALRALTVTPASLFQAQDSVGTLEKEAAKPSSQRRVGVNRTKSTNCFQKVDS